MTRNSEESTFQVSGKEIGVKNQANARKVKRGFEVATVTGDPVPRDAMRKI